MPLGVPKEAIDVAETVGGDAGDGHVSVARRRARDGDRIAFTNGGMDRFEQSS